MITTFYQYTQIKSKTFRFHFNNMQSQPSLTNGRTDPTAPFFSTRSASRTKRQSPDILQGARKRTRSHSLPPEWKISHNSTKSSLPSLPFEIRYQIYGYIFHDTMIHVRRRRIATKDLPGFVWAPCIQSSINGHLCLSLNSNWSQRLYGVNDSISCGQAAEHRAQAINITSLIWTCRAIANEAFEIFFTSAIIDTDVNDGIACLRSISYMGGLKIRRMTLSGNLNALEPPPKETGFTVNPQMEAFDSRSLLQLFPNITNITIQIRSQFGDSRAWQLWMEAAKDIKIKEIQITRCKKVWGIETLLVRRWLRMRDVNVLWTQDTMRISLHHRTVQTLPRSRSQSEDDSESDT